jgi:nitric oxide synthase oxygenase domain/subunit
MADFHDRRDGKISNPALDALRYHVSGAIERGEAEPIIGITADDVKNNYSEDDEFDDTDLRYMQNEHEGDGVMVGGTAICETCGAKLNRVTDKCKDPNHNRPISTSQQSGY